jgi:hypothetical protein
MNQHPYLRAFMAGITIPTIVLLVAMTAFTIARYVFNVPLPIERVIVFPLAVVPNSWGAWNILWLASGRRIPIGIFGAFLPFLLVPGGVLVLHLVGLSVTSFVPRAIPLFLFPIGVVVYYLVWKYLVASLNRIVGVA